MKDPDDVIEAAEREKEAIRDHYLPAVEWFLDTPGLERRETVVTDLAADLEVEEPVARAVVSHLVSDDVDPVQQVSKPSEGRFVGVIDYAEHGWFYTFDRYDDVEGRQTRAVCARCVHEAESEAAVAHYTRAPDAFDHDAATAALGLHHHVDHEGRSVGAAVRDLFGVAPDALVGAGDTDAPSVDRAVEAIEDVEGTASLSRVGDRVRRAVPDVDVEPGASLVSGTTMGGNQAWHDGNVSAGNNVAFGELGRTINVSPQGDGSGLNADTVDGQHASSLGGTNIQRNVAGTAYTGASYQKFTTFTTGLTAPTTKSLTITVTNAPAFLNYSGATKVSFQGFRANGSYISLDTVQGRLVTDVEAGDKFTFPFKLTASLTGTKYVKATVRLADYATTA